MQNLHGMSHKEITEILTNIQIICSDNICEECPFSDRDGECIFNIFSPSEWEIMEEEPQIWKAMR